MPRQYLKPFPLVRNPSGMIMYDLTGIRFGMLTVIAYAGQAHWHTRCDCGTLKRVYGNDLRKGGVKTCGCASNQLRVKGRGTHGLSDTPEYGAWSRMIQRCFNPNCKKFHCYGGRGISICDRWIEENGAVNFITDMGKRPSPQHSLDRIDVNGDYEPGNCRWATQKVQTNNTRRNRRLTFRGETLTIAEWSHRTGLNKSCILARITVLGWGVERALTESSVQAGENHYRYSGKLTDDDVRTVREQYRRGAKQADLAKQYGVHRAVICQIVHGHSRAVTTPMPTDILSA